MAIDRELWLSAREAARRPSADENDPHAYTKQEVAAMLGVERSSGHRWLAIMIRRGLVTKTTKVVLRSDGRYYRVPAYRLAMAEAGTQQVNTRRKPLAAAMNRTRRA